MAHFLRDQPSSWTTFNGWTWALTAPALAIAHPSAARELLRSHNQTLNIPYGDAIKETNIREACLHTIGSGAEAKTGLEAARGEWLQT